MKKGFLFFLDHTQIDAGSRRLQIGVDGMSKADFVHLHTHSHYSLKRGVSSVGDLVRQAAFLGFDALALTDQNSLAGIPSFIRLCEKYGIKPIVGCDISIHPFRKRIATVDQEGEEFVYHSTMLAHNEIGFHNLIKLVNRVQINASTGVPAITFFDLEEASEGLFFLTGGHRGELYHLLKRARIEETEEYLRRLIRIFGRRHVYFELHAFQDERERTINGRIIQLAGFLELGICATNDVCYVLTEDEPSSLALGGGESLLEAGVGRPFGEILHPPIFTRHLASTELMREKFRSCESAIESTREIADACEFDLAEFYSTPLPPLPLHDFVRGRDADSFLWDTIFEEAGRAFGTLSEEIKERLNREFKAVKDHGLADFIILLHRVAGYLSLHKIPFIFCHDKLNTCLISHLLGLEEVNPMDFRVRFQSFSSFGRKNQMALFHIPAPYIPETVKWITKMFHPGSVCHMGDYVSWTRSNLLDRIAQWARLSKHETRSLHREAVGTGTGKKQEPDQDDGPPFADYIDYVKRSREKQAISSREFLLRLFSRLHPRPRKLQIVPGSVAFCSRDLEAILPCEWGDEKPLSQFSEEIADNLGLPRMIFQSNPLLDILDEAISWVRIQGNPKFSVESIDFKDEQTYALLGKGNTDGIPFFDSITLKSLLRKHSPDSFMAFVKTIIDSGLDHGLSTDNMVSTISLCRLGFSCAGIKSHYPASFMTAALNLSFQRAKGGPRAKRGNDSSPGSSFFSLIRHTKRMGIPLKPCSVNESDYRFSQEGEGIRTGLMVVRMMGEKACRELVNVRQGGPFNDLADLCNRTDSRLINHRLLVNLIKAGALDVFNMKRSQMLHVLEQTIGYSREQMEQGGDTATFLEPDMDLFSQLPDLPEYSPRDLTLKEREATGYQVSRYPLEPYIELLGQMGAISLENLSLKHEGTVQYIGGFIDHVDTEGAFITSDICMILDFEGLLVKVPAAVSERYGKAIQINIPVLIGGVVERNGDYPALNLRCLYTLCDLASDIQSVKKLILDCGGPPAMNMDDFRQLHRLLKDYHGEAVVEAMNVPEGGARISRKIRKLRILFSPPLYLALKNILPLGGMTLYTDRPTPDEDILSRW